MKATHEIYGQYHAAAKALTFYSTKIQSLSSASWALFKAQSQDRMFLLSPICELFEKLAAVNATSATAHDRVSDDLRDIVERHKVLERITNDRKAAAKSLESARAKITDFEEQTTIASARKDFNQGRADAQMVKLQAAKKDALVRARDITVTLIAERKKFSSFAYRRLRQAFALLGSALTTANETELRIIARLVEGLQQAREGTALADTAFEGVELPPVAEAPAAEATATATAAAPRRAADPGTDAVLGGGAPAERPPEKEEAPPEPAQAGEEEEEQKQEKPKPPPVSVRITAKNAVLFEDSLFGGVPAEEPRQANREAPRKLKVFDVEDLAPLQSPPEAHEEPATLVKDHQEDNKPPPLFDLQAEGIDVPDVPDDGPAPTPKKGKKKAPTKKRATLSPFDDI